MHAERRHRHRLDSYALRGRPWGSIPRGTLVRSLSRPTRSGSGKHDRPVCDAARLHVRGLPQQIHPTRVSLVATFFRLLYLNLIKTFVNWFTVPGRHADLKAASGQPPPRRRKSSGTGETHRLGETVPVTTRSSPDECQAAKAKYPVRVNPITMRTA
jgi:hypothetical protein